jgi:hypothetical protein
MHEAERRDQIVARLLSYIREGRTIRLPDFDGSSTSADYALLAVPENDFSGTYEGFRYQFEGEEDLLHLAIMRQDGAPLTVEQAQQVVSFLLPEVPPALIWLKPGNVSQHFYFGHDILPGL